MGMTNYTKEKILKHTMADTAYTMPANIYLGLFTSDPTVTGDQSNEVSAADYVRIDITGKFTFGIDDAINNATLAYATAVNNWGSITHVAILDATTAGNMLYFSALGSTAVINAGNKFVILVNDLVNTIT